jgi:hypothetical protein
MANLITPPPELVQQWVQNWHSTPGLLDCRYEYIATQAAQWGADQELEACVNWLDDTDCEDPQEVAQRLRAARRPKPPSLKEQALKILSQDEWSTEEEGIIRRALEALDD